MGIRRWLGTVVLGLVLGLATGWCVLLVGSSKVIVCGTGNVVDQVAEDVTRGLGGGVIDGPDAGRCSVPSTPAWIGAVGALVAVVALTIVVSCLLARRRHLARSVGS